MENKFLYVIDCTTGYLSIIELTPEEIKESENEKYKDFEDFLITLEDKYGFRLKNSSWMVSNCLKIDAYSNGEKVSLDSLNIDL